MSRMAMARSKTLKVVLLGAMVLALAVSLDAQTVTGELVGTVTDPSNAVVPGATIKITNAGTNSVRTFQTDNSGNFYAGGLFVGVYAVEAQADGFKNFIARDIPIRAAQVRRVDVVLELGAETETITVDESVSAIQSESATIASALPQKLISDKAVSTNTRAGYVFDQLMWTSGSSSGTGGWTIFGGVRQAQQHTTIEGASVANNARPPINAVGELTAILSNAPAEYARPVTLNASFRSGTNQFHGEWQEDFLSGRLDAVKTPFFSGPRQPAAPIWRHMFSLGGPVYIPKLYDGRNKTFFFFTFLTIRGVMERQFLTENFPTRRMQGGDFSRFPTIIRDPTTGMPFPGNIIPSDRISAVAKTFVATDMNQHANYQGDPDGFRSNVFANGLNQGVGNSLVLKLDQNVGSKSVVNLTIMNGPYAGSSNSPGDGTQVLRRDHNKGTVHSRVLSLGVTHTFSPTFLSETRLGVRRWHVTRGSGDQNGNFVEGLAELNRYGIQGISGTPDRLPGGPAFSFSGWYAFARTTGFVIRDSRFQGNQNFTKVRGSHTFKAGVSAIRLHDDNTANGPYFGTFSFDGRFTGDSWSDFLLGAPSTFARFRGRVFQSPRRWELGAFFQDDYKITPKLTLSYGLRWDKFTVPYDKNRLFYNFDLRTGSIVVPDEFARKNVNPAWPTASIPIKLASEVGLPEKLQYGRSDIAPRFGFAYRPTGSANTVIRGGYGTYTGALRFGSLQLGGPFAITESFVNSLTRNADGTSTPLYTFPSPFPSQQIIVAQSNAVHVSPHYRTPFVQSWNLTFERQLLGNWAVRTSYKGVRTTQLAYSRNANTPLLSTEPFSQARRPFPNLQNVTVIENGASDSYNAWETVLTHTFSNGLFLHAGYTLQYSKTDAHGGTGIDQDAPGIEYAFDRARDKGNNMLWPRQDFVMNFLWEPPVGSGRRFAGNLKDRFGVGGSLLNAIVGGWTFSGAFSARSGLFFTPTYSGRDPGNIQQFSGRANVAAGCDVYANQSISRWVNSACFTVPQAGTLGNAQINSLVGPAGYVVLLNPWKEFPLGFREGARFQVGANIYNLFNHPILGTPTPDLTSVNFGRINSISVVRVSEAVAGGSGMRAMAITMKLIF